MLLRDNLIQIIYNSFKPSPHVNESIKVAVLFLRLLGLFYHGLNYYHLLFKRFFVFHCSYLLIVIIYFDSAKIVIFCELTKYQLSYFQALTIV